MDSFEDLEVGPELVEALAAEGIERPTPLQEAALPVLRKGHNLVLAAGPGSGLLAAWVVPLLARVEPEGPTPQVVALTATRESADLLAESTARLAASLGLTAAALGSAWVLPERAHVVFATPEDALAAASRGLALGAARALVVDQAQQLESLGALDAVEGVLGYVAPEAQRVVSALPVTPGVADLIARHCKRAPTLPPPDPGGAPDRGRLRFRVVAEPRESAALALAEELLHGDARHVLFYSRSEDTAADLGDHLTLHGFVAGAPGDAAFPVWLGVDALAGRAAAAGTEGLVVVSFHPPPDPDTLDRRHAVAPDGVALVLARELAHLKSVARRTGYSTVPFPPPPPRAPSSVERLRERIERALAETDVTPWLPVLEPLFERHDPAEVAAATLALLRESKPAPEVPERRPAEDEAAPAPVWVKLFIGVGERDGLRPGDLVGAITGEAGVDGRQVGRIEIRDTHSVVEVHESVARRVIKALNGTTIKGRAVRADFDRPRRGRQPRAPRPR
ncbi:MAG TPA: DbpA RNA binding domain-containing protein [Longimicrobiales bacterium]|nr:DbpA RNA binding domain-containing protein [Longimicrobiales bacterium]